MEQEMHPSTYDYLKPTEKQMEKMARLRQAAKEYGEILESLIPDEGDEDELEPGVVP